MDQSCLGVVRGQGFEESLLSPDISPFVDVLGKCRKLRFYIKHVRPLEVRQSPVNQLKPIFEQSLLFVRMNLLGEEGVPCVPHLSGHENPHRPGRQLESPVVFSATVHDLLGPSRFAVLSQEPEHKLHTALVDSLLEASADLAILSLQFSVLPELRKNVALDRRVLFCQVGVEQTVLCALVQLADSVDLQSVPTRSQHLRAPKLHIRFQLVSVVQLLNCIGFKLTESFLSRFRL